MEDTKVQELTHDLIAKLELVKVEVFLPRKEWLTLTGVVERKFS
jgi:hypothetical protein